MYVQLVLFMMTNTFFPSTLGHIIRKDAAFG